MPNIISKALTALKLKGGREYSNIKRDESVIFFNTAAWLNEETNEWNIPIHGWVYEPQSSWAMRTLVSELLVRKYGLRANEKTKTNFSRRLNLFTADNERRKRVIIDFKGELYELPKSEPNGQFEGIIKRHATQMCDNQEGLIHFSAELSPSDNRAFTGTVSLIRPSGVSVISDIDDTVKRSFIHDRKKMFDAAFYQDFKAVKGMPEVYRQWEADGAKFHFVSSSPWQLYQPLVEFLEESDFPRASLSLKKVRIKDETFLNLFKSGLVTKPAAIKTILERYPQRKFILVGDSGEQDPQAYASVAHDHPHQIAKILIRNVHSSKTLNEEYTSTFEGLNRRLWKTFVYPSQIKLDIKAL